jgi:glucose-1-phosphatase
MNRSISDPSSTTIQLVLFDLGGVLVNVSVDSALNHWSEATGATQNTFEEHLFASGLKEKMDKGLLSSEDVMEIMQEKTGLSRADFKAGWEKVLTPKPEMLPVLEAVCDLIPSGLLSNTDPIHHETALRLLPPLSRLSPQFVSYDEGCWKPEALFYQQILRPLTCPPSAVFFVDDLPQNVEGARAAGMDAVLFESASQFRKALESRGLVITLPGDTP